MKNKGFFKTAAALLAALVLLGGFSVTAYAGGGEDIPTNDSGVIVETEPQPLTPDGNLSLIDDIEGEAAEDKQFIIVQSKNGNYFYIIVDRAAEGENTVHFLNQVDEADLMALMEDGSSKTYTVTVYVDKGTLADQFWDKLTDFATQVPWWQYAEKQQSTSKYPKYW